MFLFEHVDTMWKLRILIYINVKLTMYLYLLIDDILFLCYAFYIFTFLNITLTERKVSGHEMFPDERREENN